MPNEIAKVVINWTGFAGAPGFTNLYFNDFTEGTITQAIVTGARTRCDALLMAILPAFPNTVSATVDSTVEIIDVASGDLIRIMSGPAFTIRVGSGTGSYSAASGAVVNWTTGGIVQSRRVRGRMFLVPLAGSSYATNGTILETMRGTLNTAINAFLAPGSNQGLVGVYSRKSKQHLNKKGETVPAHDGAWFPVQSFSIPDKVAVLRSRRD